MAEPVVLSPERKKLLQKLKVAAAIKGEEWLNVDSIDKRVLRGLTGLGYILMEERNKHLYARITGRGNVALRYSNSQAESNSVEEADAELVPGAAVDVLRAAVSTSFNLVNAAMQPEQKEDCEPSCEGGCTHRRVLELLMKRNPKIRELLETSFRLEKLLEGFDASN